MKNVHTDFRPIDIGEEWVQALYHQYECYSFNQFKHSSLLLLYFLYVKPQQLNFLAACLTFGNIYLDILASLIIIVLSLLMLLITMQQPEMLMVYFETSGRDIVFTWRMRLVADIIQIMFKKRKKKSPNPDEKYDEQRIGKNNAS